MLSLFDVTSPCRSWLVKELITYTIVSTALLGIRTLELGKKLRGLAHSKRHQTIRFALIQKHKACPNKTRHTSISRVIKVRVHVT